MSVQYGVWYVQWWYICKLATWLWLCWCSSGHTMASVVCSPWVLTSLETESTKPSVLPVSCCVCQNRWCSLCTQLIHRSVWHIAKVWTLMFTCNIQHHWKYLKNKFIDSQIWDTNYMSLLLHTKSLFTRFTKMATRCHICTPPEMCCKTVYINPLSIATLVSRSVWLPIFHCEPGIQASTCK